MNFKSAVRRSWSLYRQHFVTFAFIAAVPIAISEIFLRLKVPLGGMLDWTFTLLVLALMLFAHAMIVAAAFYNMRGEPMSVLEVFRLCGARGLPAFAVAAVFFVCIMNGLALLLFPGLWAMAAWALAIPVCVVERTGIVASFKRSAHLTSGYRWETLGAMCTALIAGFGILILTDNSLAGYVWMVFAGGYFGVFSAILYYDLRSAKEGVRIEEIAAVFD